MNNSKSSNIMTAENICVPDLNNIPSVVPVCNTLYALQGKLYLIPFMALRYKLSDSLSIKSTSRNYFPILNVKKINDTFGYMQIATTAASGGTLCQSVISVFDKENGELGSVSISHSTQLLGFSIQGTKISEDGKTITCTLKVKKVSSYNILPIQPKVTLSRNIKYKVSYQSDYFNQLCMHDYYTGDIQITLEEYFSGNLDIKIEDLLQNYFVSTTVKVDYKK